jgi:POT family proton-dependent oligopeptide transporter
LLSPVMEKVVYPIVHSHGITFGPISRVTWAFIMMSTAMAFAAGVQNSSIQKVPATASPCNARNLRMT